MQYNFKKFIGKNAKKTPSYFVFTKNGFYFSSGFIKQEGLEKKKFVQLFHDSKNNAIGFQFFENRVGNSIITTKSRYSNLACQLTAINFRKEFNLNKKENYGKRIILKKFIDEIGEMFIVDLD